MLKYKIETDLDDPATSLKHREIILSKPFLKKIYLYWYSFFTEGAKALPEGTLLEIGSGGGFLKEVMPNIVTSDIQPLPHCDKVFSAEAIPFPDNSVAGIFMVNVFHHIPKPHLFLKEAERVLKPGGKIIMVEPANSPWSRLINKNFHHEPFDEKGGWEIASTGPMSGSNQALPYIYFERDRQKTEQTFRQLTVEKITYHSPVSYIISGGVSRHAMLPSFSYGIIHVLEKACSPLARLMGMFMTAEITKK